MLLSTDLYVHLSMLICLQWRYESSQYTVWCSLLIELNTRFRFYLLCALYVRCISHVNHVNFMRSDYHFMMITFGHKIMFDDSKKRCKTYKEWSLKYSSMIIFWFCIFILISTRNTSNIKSIMFERTTSCLSNLISKEKSITRSIKF
jgi:hypothetical protein